MQRARPMNEHEARSIWWAKLHWKSNHFAQQFNLSRKHCMHRDLCSRRRCISVSLARGHQLDFVAPLPGAGIWIGSGCHAVHLCQGLYDMDWRIWISMD
jgi:hypothetical protein